MYNQVIVTTWNQLRHLTSKLSFQQHIHELVVATTMYMACACVAWLDNLWIMQLRDLAQEYVPVILTKKLYLSTLLFSFGFVVFLL